MLQCVAVCCSTIVQEEDIGCYNVAMTKMYVGGALKGVLILRDNPLPFHSNRP